jgi:dCMP deaminase
MLERAEMTTRTSDLGKTTLQIERERREERGERWDMRFLQLADTVAQWSKDPKHKVGAVLVDDHQRIMGVGYNGFPDRCDDDPRTLASDRKHEAMVHAEMNAILNCPVPTRGLTCYSTHSPCVTCQPMIVQAGLVRLVYWSPTAAWQAKHPINSVIWGTRGITHRSVQRPDTAVPGSSFSL